MRNILEDKRTTFYSQIFYNDIHTDHETYSTFKKESQKSIINVLSSNLMQFFNEHIRVNKKYYEIYKSIMNDFTVAKKGRRGHYMHTIQIFFIERKSNEKVYQN